MPRDLQLRHKSEKQCAGKLKMFPQEKFVSADSVTVVALRKGYCMTVILNNHISSIFNDYLHNNRSDNCIIIILHYY